MSRDVIQDSEIQKLKLKSVITALLFLDCIRDTRISRVFFVLINRKHNSTVIANRNPVSFMTYLEYIYLFP